MGQAAQTPIYENCRIESPEGITLCLCHRSRADWYINRDLAVVVTENPYTVRLKFKPKGYGHNNSPFYLSPKQNICTVCGTDEDLNRHHCVPRCYRRYFTDTHKSHDMHDVFPLCIKCHNEYEEQASKLKEQIGKEFGIPLNGYRNNKAEDAKYFRLRSHANALLNHWDKIPEHRKDFLLADIREHLGKQDVSKEELQQVMEQAVAHTCGMTYYGEHDCHGEGVVARLTDIHAFIRQWRQHFVDTMKPKHLPAHWRVDHEGKDFGVKEPIGIAS
jgi:hypothetical protein